MESKNPSIGGLGDASTSDSAEILARALELRENGHADWLEQATADCPQLRDEVGAAVERALMLPSIFADGVSADALVGTTLVERYEVQRRVGAGAMGVVYEAQDLELKRRVAVKVLRTGMMEHERAVARFEREAQAMAAVDHPSVIAIHDRGRTKHDEAFIVMDFVDGVQLGTLIEDLSERFDDGQPVEPGVLGEQLGVDTQGEANYLRVAVSWIADLAAAIHQTHAAGVVHRDIKPSNILIRRDGRPVLLDFGVALLEDAATLTHAGSGVGTPAYMPPESLQRERRTTESGDVYSLAAVLYCMVGLRPPYKGTPTQVLASLATREPEPLAKLRQDLPRDLQAIVEQGMARRPGQRYADASQLEADLRAFLEHRPIKARPTGPLRRTLRRARNSKAVRGAALGVVLAAAIAAGFKVRGDVLEVRQERSRLALEERKGLAREFWREFPPNFTIVMPHNRVRTDEDEREALRDLLDRAGEAAVDPLPIVLLRSSFRLDHGDVAGSVSDMLRIAEHEDTPLARAIADSYAQLDTEAGSSWDLDSSAWPEPAGSRDRYLLAYHGLRGDRSLDFMANLGEKVREDVPHAEQLHIAATVSRMARLGPRERVDAANDFIERIARLEEAYQVETAGTEHFRGAVYGIAGWPDRALAASLRSIELAPSTHVNRTNAAAAAVLLEDFALAREQALAGLGISPSDWKCAEHLIWSYVGLSEFDEGQQAVDAFEPEVDSLTPGFSDSRRALLEIYRALQLRTSGFDAVEEVSVEREERIRVALDLAQEFTARVIEKDTRGRVSDFRPDHYLALIEAIRGQEPIALFEVFADEAIDQGNPWLFNRVLDFFPEERWPASSGQTNRALVQALLDEWHVSKSGFAGKQLARASLDPLPN